MMRKIDIQKKDPERYARVKAEQEELEKECPSGIKLEMLCPYCDEPVTTVIKGSHGYVWAVCPRCEQKVLFPPVKFRMAR